MAGREQPSGRIRRTGPERFLGGQRHGGAPRGGVPVARDGPRLASVVSRLTSATVKGSTPPGAPPAPHSGVGGDAVAQVTAGSPAEASATAAQKGWRRRSGGDAEARRMQQPGCTNAPRERDRLRGQATRRAV